MHTDPFIEAPTVCGTCSTDVLEIRGDELLDECMLQPVGPITRTNPVDTIKNRTSEC